MAAASVEGVDVSDAPRPWRLTVRLRAFVVAGNPIIGTGGYAESLGGRALDGAGSLTGDTAGVDARA